MAETEEPPVTRRSWISLAAVLFVQTQNAFNDNFVKVVLIALGFAVAQGMTVLGVDLGNQIQYILTALIPIPFILAAPVAGWLSDRFSKKNVIIASLFLQLTIFLLILFALLQKQVLLAIFGYFLLAVQSTIFSPAKQGILKELVGSARLGLANGLMQMLTMIGILAGAGLGGFWFRHLAEGFNEANGESVDNAWSAAMWPTLFIGIICILPLVVSFFIQRTPSHPGKTFTPAICVRHFKHLALLSHRPGMRSVAVRIGLYWFVANYLGVLFFSFGRELFPNPLDGGAAETFSKMMLFVGIGLLIGSVFVSILSRSGIKLKLIPKGAAGMMVGLLGILLLDPSGWYFRGAVALVGFSSGFFIIPLSAWLQDLAPEDERGRIISASNLINAFTGLVAIGVCNGLDSLGFSASGQAAPVCLLMAGMTVWTLPFLKGKSAPSAAESD